MKFEEEFDEFIKKWCGNSYSHLSDSDENDGEELRQFVEDNYLNKQRVKEVIDKLTYDCNKDKTIEWELGGMIDADELIKELRLEK